ncbi:MAG: 30S ribosomal protein S6 [Deltaproteobacteria bacterium]
MNQYEAMFIIKPDLNEEERQAVLKAIRDQIVKQEGKITSDEVWAERRRLAYDLFPVGGGTRFREGTYFLVRFESAPTALDEIKKSYSLNENILRTLILRAEAALPVLQKPLS